MSLLVFYTGKMLHWLPTQILWQMVLLSTISLGMFEHSVSQDWPAAFPLRQAASPWKAESETGTHVIINQHKTERQDYLYTITSNQIGVNIRARWTEVMRRSGKSKLAVAFCDVSFITVPVISHFHFTCHVWRVLAKNPKARNVNIINYLALKHRAFRNGLSVPCLGGGAFITPVQLFLRKLTNGENTAQSAAVFWHKQQDITANVWNVLPQVISG